LPTEVHIGFYRIAQESLNNVVKHARAGLVSISLSATPPQIDPAREWSGEVKLVIRDDGIGFNLQEVGAQHLGLGIMWERAAVIGADLDIESQPALGTTVTITWHKHEGTKND
jgi:signal transduction histidine kinase